MNFLLKNYLKIAWRNLSQHKSYSLINLFGLAVGMACCVLISLYIKEELSYDRFHEHSDRITAVGVGGGFFGRTLSTPYPLADALVNEIPEVEKAVRLDGTGSMSLSADRQDFMEIEDGLYAEPSFFEVFSFSLLSGSREDALAAPNSIVLSRSTSRRLFGTEEVLGKPLYWQKRDTVISLAVTGIVEDEPLRSSIDYDAIISFETMDEDRRDPGSWNSYFLATYALLQSPQSFKALPSKLDTLARKQFREAEGANADRSFFTVPLDEYHLSEDTDNSGFTGNRAYVYLFGSVALFILLIAGVNYVNLATARASLRSKEVGVRKTLGALKKQLAAQFVGESVILSLAAYLLGCLGALAVLPHFNQLFGTSLVWQANISFLLWLIAIAVGIGILAGLYPSLYLSSFTPSRVLRNQKARGSSGSILRKILVVTQFAIALVLIIGSLIVYEQLQYTQNKDLGFNGDQVVAVSMPSQRAWEQRETIKSNLAQYSGIMELSMSMGVPGEFNVRMGNEPDKLAPENKIESEETIVFAPAIVDENFLSLLEIDLVAGRSFSEERGTDVSSAYILNEKGAEMLGWTPEEAIGKTFGSNEKGTIIGVVENFHISSLHNDIEGVYLQLSESVSFFSGGTLLVKLASGQISETLDQIKTEVSKFSPNFTFSYEFLDDKFDAMYRTEQRFGKIVALFTAIAIIIACLGLYGLAAFSAERRVKEIGIRKVLGASVPNIIRLLSKDFLKLVILGFMIAVPIAWYAMNQWLSDFAYRIEIGAGIFILAGLSAVCIALATVSWQSIRAAVANPVDSLRSE